jgi:hypothetical protein
MKYRLGKFDLSQGTLEDVPFPDDFYRDYIGGSGIAAGTCS